MSKPKARTALLFQRRCPSLHVTPLALCKRASFNRSLGTVLAASPAAASQPLSLHTPCRDGTFQNTLKHCQALQASSGAQRFFCLSGGPCLGPVHDHSQRELFKSALPTVPHLAVPDISPVGPSCEPAALPMLRQIPFLGTVEVRTHQAAGDSGDSSALRLTASPAKHTAKHNEAELVKEAALLPFWAPSVPDQKHFRLKLRMTSPL